MTEPQKPDLAQIVLDPGKQGSVYASAHPDEMVDMAATKS